MPRDTPVEYRQIAYAESAADGIIDLITITYETGGSPSPVLNLARNGEAVVSDGVIYEPFWFEILTPEMREDGSFTRSTLRIDAVDQRVILALRSVTRPMVLQHKAVLISDPDNVTHGPWTYQIRDDQTYDQQTLELALTFEPVLSEQCPWKRLSPSRAPGLF